MFVSVAKVSEVPDPGKLLVEVDERLIVLAHVEGKFYAIDDVCTHDGGPLGEGELDGFTIACPRHGAKFDVRDGRALTMPATKPTGAYAVKLEGDQVFVDLSREAGSTCCSETAPSAVTTSIASSMASPSAPTAAGSAEATASTASADSAGSVNEDTVREALKQVIDPELFVNVVDLGLIYGVVVEDVDGKSNIKIDMTMTSPACPAGPQLVASAQKFVGAIPGAGTVEVKIVMVPPWTPDRMTEDARDQLGIF